MTEPQPPDELEPDELEATPIDDEQPEREVELAAAGVTPLDSVTAFGTGTPATSPRFGAPRYSDADPADFAACVNPITDALDAAAMQGQGGLSSRPAAGKQGRFYLDTLNGQLYWDSGGAWYQVGSQLVQYRSASATVNPGELSIVSGGNNLALTLPTSPPPGTRNSFVHMATTGSTINPGPGDGINNYNQSGAIQLPPTLCKYDLEYSGGVWYVYSPPVLPGGTQIFQTTYGSPASSWLPFTGVGGPSDLPITLNMPVGAGICPIELGMSFYCTQGLYSPNPAGAVRFSCDQLSGPCDGVQFDVPSTGVNLGNMQQHTIIQRVTSLPAGVHTFRPQIYAYGGGAAYCDWYCGSSGNTSSGGWPAYMLGSWWARQLPS